MTVAIPIAEGCISPVLDTAARLLIMTITTTGRTPVNTPVPPRNHESSPPSTCLRPRTVPPARPFPRLGELIEHLQAMTEVPAAVLTNGSLLWQESVREELALADLVMPSLDAPDAERFAFINRPHPEVIAEYRGRRKPVEPEASTQAVLSPLQRRPCTLLAVAHGLGLKPNEAIKNICRPP